MFQTFLWAAFIVELFVGIMLGWFMAQLYFKRKEALDIALMHPGTKDFSLNTPNGSAASGKVGIVQAIAQDRTSIQMRTQQLEKSLAETQTFKQPQQVPSIQDSTAFRTNHHRSPVRSRIHLILRTLHHFRITACYFLQLTLIT